MKKKKMYLSFPITGRCLADVKVYARRVKKKWTDKGYDVVTPFEVAPAEGMPYAYYMGRDIEALIGCDGVIFCPDWFSSRGCRLEFDAAQIYRKVICVDDTKYMGRYEDGEENQV